jgi:diguanylate cyclase (GGDEF)-like protein
VVKSVNKMSIKTDMTGDRYEDLMNRRVVAGLNRDQKAVTIMLGADATIEWASSGAASFLGYEFGELIGTSAVHLVHPDELADLAATLQTSLAEPSPSLSIVRDGHRHVLDLRLRHKTEGWILVSMHANSCLDDPDVRSIVVQIFQPDSYRDLFFGLRSLAEHDSLPDALSSLLRALSAGGPGRTVGLIVDDEDCVLGTTPDCPLAIGDSIGDGLGDWATFTSQLTVPITGTTRLLVVSSLATVHPINRIVADQVAHLARLAITTHDDRLRLHELAHKDELTGVANRRQFNECLADTSGKVETISLAVVDIDQFKLINDRYGHAVGDLVLVEVAKVLSESLRHDDVVARVGGDEFALLLRGAVGEDSRVLRRLRKRLTGLRVLTPNGVVTVNASLGVASAGASSLTDMLRLADGRLYEEKQSRLVAHSALETRPRRSDRHPSLTR